MCSQRLIAVMFLAGLCTACGSISRLGAPPSIAMGHLGQVVTASSETRQGQPLVNEAISVATALKTANQAVLQDLASRDFNTAKRRMFDLADIVEPRENSAQSPTIGLRRTVERALLHTELALRSNDTDETLRRTVLAARKQSGEIIENIETLSTYMNLGLSEYIPDSLTIIAKEIDDVTNRIIGNTAGSYGLYDLERDLELAIADSGYKFILGDDWYLKHFKPGSDNRWTFEPRPLPCVLAKTCSARGRGSRVQWYPKRAN